MYRLRLFGGVSLEGPSGPLSGRAVQKRQLALLALLGAGGEKGWSRDKLVGLLWPESDEEGARHRLSGSLYELRRALGEDAVLASGETLRLNHEMVWSDVRAFDEAIGRQELEAAVNLYAGPFLDGFYVNGVRDFQAWTDAERQRLGGLYEGALETLATDAEAKGDFPDAVVCWQRLAAHDMYNSRFSLRLMQAMAAAGDPANAIQHAKEHERILRDELDMELPPDVQALAERLREEPPSTPKAPEESHAAVQALESEPQEDAVGRRKAGGAHRFLNLRDALLAGVVVAAIVSVIVSGYIAMRVLGFGSDDPAIANSALEARERIILAEFENQTGDSTLALAATEALRINLDQSYVVRIAQPDYVGGVLTRMEREPTARLDLALAREVAIREGLKAVIAGEVISTGSAVVLSVRLLAADSGEVLLAYRETADDSTAIMTAVDRLSEQLRVEIGESLKTVRSNPPLPQVTTSSLEALQKYSQALRSGLSDRLSTIALLEEAIALDSTFAMAWRKLGVYAWSFDSQRGRDAYTRAYQLRDHLTDRERYLTEGTYYQRVTGEKEKAAVAYRRLLDRYPDVYEARGNLGGLYTQLGDLAAAERLYQRGIELDSTLTGIWRYLFNVQYKQGKFDEVEETFRHIERLFPEYPPTPWLGAHLAYSRGDYVTAEERLNELIEKHGAIRTWIVSAGEVQGSLDLVQGRLRVAEARAQRTRDADSENGAIRAYHVHTGPLALIAHLRGDPEPGLRAVEAALERYPLESMSPRSRPYLAVARTYALYLDRPDIARGFLDDHERELDTLTQQRRSADWHDALGVVLLVEGRSQEAIEHFRTEYMISASRTGAPAFLARAFDQAGQPDSAIAYFEHYVTTPVLYRAYGDHLHLPYAYERLGQLYQEQGEPEAAIYWHQKFVDLWEDADPELQPRVEAARESIAALTAASSGR